MRACVRVVFFFSTLHSCHLKNDVNGFKLIFFSHFNFSIFHCCCYPCCPFFYSKQNVYSISFIDSLVRIPEKRLMIEWLAGCVLTGTTTPGQSRPRIMAMKVYSTYPKAPYLEPNYQMV